MNQVVVMTDPGCMEGSRLQLQRAVELLTGESPILMDARRFMDGADGRAGCDDRGLTLEMPSEGLVVRPSIVIVYEIAPADRRRLAAFQAVLARSGAVSLAATEQSWRNATEKPHMVTCFIRDRIPQMESIALERPSMETAAAAFARLGGNVWARPSIGTNGNHVFHVTSEQQLRAAVAYYATAGLDWLITRDAENFNPQGKRHQFRVVVMGERVLRVCEHIQENPDVPCNESKGAVSTLLSPDALPAEMHQLAVRATQSVGLPFGGVDLAVENGGVVFEVNVHPVLDGTRGLETVAIPYVEAHLAAARRTGRAQRSSE